MKTPRFSTARAVVAGALMLASSAAFAAATDTLTIKGTVAGSLTVDVVGTLGHDALALGGHGSDDVAATKVQVADITVLTNNSAGATVSLSSTNTGALKNTSDATQTVGYTVALVNTTAEEAYNAGTTPFGAIGSVTKPVAQGTSEVEMYISYDPAAYLEAGSYEDTITVTVTDV